MRNATDSVANRCAGGAPDYSSFRTTRGGTSHGAHPRHDKRARSYTGSAACTSSEHCS